MANLKDDVKVTESEISQVSSHDDGNQTNAITPKPQQPVPQKPKTKKRITGAEVIKRLRLSSYWVIIAVLLAIPLVAVLLAYHKPSHSDVSPRGVLLYVEIAWCVLLVSYITVELLSRIWRRCIRILDVEDLDAYHDSFDGIKASATLFFTVMSCFIISHTDILCFRDPGVCGAEWIAKLHRALLASVLVAAAFLVKAIMVEILIARTALRNLHTTRFRVSQVVEATLWILNFLTPTAEEDEGEEVTWKFWYLEVTHYRKFWAWLLLRDSPGEDEFDGMVDAEKGDDGQTTDSASPNENHKSTDATTSNKDGHDDDDDDDDDDVDEAKEQAQDLVLSMVLELFNAEGYSLDLLVSDNDMEGAMSPIKDVQRSYKVEVWDKKRRSGSLRRALKPSDLAKLLDTDNDKFVTKRECYDMLWKEMAPTLQEVQRGIKGIRKAAKDVDVVISIILLCAAALIYAAFFMDNFSRITAPVWTGFTGLGFALGGTITEFLASCFFVFCKQPYDVGDRVTVDEKDLIVKEIHLNYSVFNQIDDGTVQQICHSKLLEMWIANKTRMKPRCSTDIIKLPKECSCADEQSVQTKLNELLDETTGNADCRRHLEEKDGLKLREVSKTDIGTWKLTIQFKYRDKLIYREENLAECREKVQCELKAKLNGEDTGGGQEGSAVENNSHIEPEDE